MKKSLLLILAFFVSLEAFETVALADSISAIVDNFNANGGTAMVFDRGSSASGALGYTEFHSLGMSQSNAGQYLSAYGQDIQGYYGAAYGTRPDYYKTIGNLRQPETGEYSGLTFFNSFCVERSGTTSGGDNINVIGKLNLTENGSGGYKTMIDVSGSAGVNSTALTMGAALLYHDMVMGNNMVMEAWCSDPNSSWFRTETTDQGWQRIVFGEEDRYTAKYVEDRFSVFGIYDIQEGIWALQSMNYDAMLASGNDYLPIYTHLMDYFGAFYADYVDLYGENWWFAEYDPTSDFLGDFSVLAINMFYEDGRGFQDHIVLVERESSTTPEPATLGLFGVGFVSLMLYRRRRVAA